MEANHTPNEPNTWEQRLTRLESIVLRAELANEEAHEDFRTEDRAMMKAQFALADGNRELRELVNRFVTASIRDHRSLKRRMRETTEKLDALIKVVDGMIQKGGEAH